MAIEGKIVGAVLADATRAIAADEAIKRKQNPHLYWFTRGLIAVTLLSGWVFILVQNKFHIDPPVVVVMLGYLAVVMTVTNLWRVGAAAVAPERSDDAWARPLGAYGELEKEKKTLLKQIKEAEFDQLMGKLSKGDAEQLSLMYRARAIEVIKELDRLEAGHAETPRQAIERELAARLLVESEKKKGDKRAKKTAAKAKAADDEAAKAKTSRKANDEAPAKPVDADDDADDDGDADVPAKAADDRPAKAADVATTVAADAATKPADDDNDKRAEEAS